MSADERLSLELLGEERGRVALPERGLLVIGSSPERAGLVLAGQGVEDAHCAIGRVKSGGWAIKDLGTRFGTFLNGERITSTRLSAGDRIVVGSRRLAVVDPDAASAPAPPETPEPPTDETPAPVRAARPAAQRAADVPERLGGYRIQKLLGRGGMGLVYLALQESLNRPVALKVVSRTLEADADFVRRFQSEARAAAALNHPNVVVVYDVGEAGGHHYLSMEFMAGGSLEERVGRDGPIRWREVLDILHDAARGLTYAEERGIVHRDIKPANLMVDGTGTTKIADLGLATGMEAEDDERGRKIYGTPHFISPEQARGEPVDGRSDLYSLGATAYRLLSGRTPFSGETTRDILRAHFTEEAEPLRDVPARLNDLILKLLAKDRADRFQRAEDLVRAVDRLRVEADHGVPVPDAPPARHGPKVALALVLVAALAGAVLWASGLLGKRGEALAEHTRSDGDVSGAPAPAGGGPAPDDGGFFDAGAAPPADPAAAPDARDRKVQELEAELAYSKVPGDLAPRERAAQLHALVGRYEGTSVARKARDEADRLEADAERAEAESARHAAALKDAIQSLGAVAAWPPPAGALPQAGDALRRVLSWQAPKEVADAPELESARHELEQRILHESGERLAAQLADADALAQKGSFAEADQLLARLLPLFELPELPAEDRPAGYDELQAVAGRARELRAALPEREKRWEAEQASGDRLRLAERLGVASDFADELRGLRLAAAEQRLDALQAELHTDSTRAVVQRLREEIGYGRKALQALIDGFGRGEWRRKTVIDPRGRRANHEAIGASAEGVQVDTDGKVGTVPWSAFDVDGIEQLFKGRLTRPYTADEMRGISFLLSLEASLQAADAAEHTLSTDRHTSFDPSAADALVAAYDPAGAWARGDVGDGPAASDAARERVAGERAAAEGLAHALSAADSGSWPTAVSALEALFQEHGGSLLVTLLSDGTPWRTEPAAGASEPAAGTPTSPPPPTSSGPDPTNGR